MQSPQINSKRTEPTTKYIVRNKVSYVNESENNLI
jgi:hypothetical protein